jgi:methionyl-tRNA synthetase
VEHYGADAVRYYLLRGFSTFADGDFSSQQLGQIYHADLANGLGNLVSRLTALGERGAYGRCCFPKVPPPPKGYADAVEHYAFGQALESLWTTVGRLNREIDAHRPWDWLKQKEKDKLNAHLDLWLGDLYGVGYWLQPFLPVTSQRLLDLLTREEISAFNSLFPRKP